MPNILICDDEKDIVSALKIYLTSAEYKTFEAYNGREAVELMKQHIARTRNAGCLDDVGGFGGCFGLPIAGMEEPVLVSGTDGCGTKVKLAILMDKHDTIGIDAVAMCVNDIICVGAKPLFFLDYIACGKNIPEKIAAIVSGVAEGCVQSGAALIGGETAEHPGMMPVEEYDLAGFTYALQNAGLASGKAYHATITADLYKRPKETDDPRLAPYFAWKGNIACCREIAPGDALFAPELAQEVRGFFEALLPFYDYWNRFKV